MQSCRKHRLDSVGQNKTGQTNSAKVYTELRVLGTAAWGTAHTIRYFYKQKIHCGLAGHQMFAKRKAWNYNNKVGNVCVT
jgi:hypothetical protein